MALVPEGVGYLYFAVIDALWVGILFGLEGKAALTEGIVLPVGPLGMALGPEDPPTWGAFSRARGDKLVNVTSHILYVQRKRHDIPAIPAFLGVDRCVHNLW